MNDEDSANYRWSDSEILHYINAAQRQIVTLVPEANVIESIEDLGSNTDARQTLPAGGIKFVKISNNFSDASTRKGPVRYAEKDALDSWDPDWEYTPGSDGDNYFKHYCHDAREDDVYYLYPPPAVSNKFIGLVYSKIPDDLADLHADLSLDDDFFESYVDYVVFRALSKEGRYSLPDRERDRLWAKFLQSLGLKHVAETNIGPETVRPPEAP